MPCKIDYEEFGAFTCYVGHLGAGTTLAAVMHLCHLKQQKPDRPIFSNLHLLRMPYTHFDRFGDIDPNNALVLVDNLEFLAHRRRAMTKDIAVLEGFLSNYRRLNTTIVASAHQYEGKIDVAYLIQKQFTTTVECRLDYEQPTMSLKARIYQLAFGDRLYTGIPVSDYFADYDSVAPVVRRGILEVAQGKVSKVDLNAL